MNDELKNLHEKAIANPRGVDFSDLITKFCEMKDFREARELCFASLKADNANNLARLELAKVYFLDNMNEFCVRELKEVHKSFPSQSLAKIIKLLGSDLSEQSATEEKVVSEIEVEFDE